MSPALLLPAQGLHPPAAFSGRLRNVETIDAMAQLLGETRSGLEVLQLRAGRLRGRVLQLAAAEVEILVIEASLPLLLRGGSTGEGLGGGLSLAPHPQGGAPLQCNGVPVGMGALFGLGPRSAPWLITAPGFQGVLIQAAGTGSMGGVASLRELQASPVVTPAAARLEALRQLLGELTTTATDGAMGQVVPLLQEALVDGLERRGAGRGPVAPRFGLVQAAIGWMDRCLTDDTSLDNLCRQVHCSRRTLIRGFSEHLGMGPIQFLKLSRLHAVRRELQRCNPTITQVAGVAGQWGFYEASNFAHAYHQLFRERPSDTLRRRAWLRAGGGLRPAAADPTAAGHAWPGSRG